MTGRGTGAAGKYLRGHVLLTCLAFGAVTAAGIRYPAASNAPVAMLLGLVLGYWLRDAVGDWRGQRALARIREARRQAQNAQQARVAELLERAQAGVVPADQLPPWLKHTDNPNPVQTDPDPGAPAEDPTPEENTNDGN